MTERETYEALLRRNVEEGYISNVAVDLMLFDYDVMGVMEDSFTWQQMDNMTDEEYEVVFQVAAKELTEGG